VDPDFTNLTKHQGCANLVICLELIALRLRAVAADGRNVDHSGAKLNKGATANSTREPRARQGNSLIDENIALVAMLFDTHTSGKVLSGGAGEKLSTNQC
jgi:hypothetical protein